VRTYHDLLNEGRRRLDDQTAQLYLNSLCQERDINLYLEMDNPMPLDLQEVYLEGIHRMENHEPMDYVLGWTMFYGRPFHVDDSVLIPRPETEELAELVLELFDQHFDKDITLFDVGTGSGALAVTLTLEEPRIHAWASDISPEALATAQKNAHDLHAPVSFLMGSMLDPYVEQGLKCDLLVCNPPYIPAQENLEESVKDFEPHVALFGGEDGLKLYRELFAKASQVMNPGGVLAFEMGWNQKEALTALAKQAFPGANVSCRKDINQKDRMLAVEMEA
jgi:release factor glutamine methyltransferase